MRVGEGAGRAGSIGRDETERSFSMRTVGPTTNPLSQTPY